MPASATRRITLTPSAAATLSRYRFLQRYRSGYPENLGEDFEVPFTRLDWVGRDRFDIQWYRHTETWFCLYRGLSLADALKTIEADGLLHPL